MEIFQIIGSMFQTPSQLSDNSMPRGKRVSLPGGKPESGSGTLTLDGRTGRSKISKEIIGAPCNFKHLAHIGWESQFATYIVNSDLQILFTKAGIKEEHLKDRRTSRRIFEIIERKGGMNAIHQEALSLALSDESRSSPSPSKMSSSAADSGDPMGAPVPPPLPLTPCSSINFIPPPPQSIPSFDNSEVVSDPNPPPPPPLPQAVECQTSISAPSSMVPPVSNDDVVGSIHIPPPPPLPPFLKGRSGMSGPSQLPTSHVCVSVDPVPILVPPPPPLPFLDNQTSINSQAIPHFHNCPPVGPPTLLPLPPPEHNASTVDKSSHSPHRCSMHVSPSSPLCIPPVPGDSTMQFPSPWTPLPSDNHSLLPPPLNPSQLQRLECLQEKTKPASEKQVDQPGLLEQIRRGILLNAVDVQVAGVTDSSSHPPAENKGILPALMDVIQKRQLALQFSLGEELDCEEDWDDY